MFFLKILLAKAINFISQALKLGSGSTWPGHFILQIDKNIIEKILKKNPHLKIIIITGTNGKTTTTSMLKYSLEKLGKKVFSNQEGANLINGIASILLKKSDFFGSLNYDFALFEVDEFNLPLVLEKLTPNVLILLNLFRDQLDRYGEVNTIGSRWFQAIEEIKKNFLIVANGDDPYIFYNVSKLSQQKIFFGISKKLMKLKKIPHDVDFIYCPNCQSPLNYNAISYSHLGDFDCPKCQFKRSKTLEDFSQIKINYPLAGIYNMYNAHAVLATVKSLFNFKNFKNLLKNFQSPFGRQEKINYQNRIFFILLSKNPAGFNQSLKTIKRILRHKKAIFFIILNNRIPDGRDVSWIWDTDIKIIKNNAKKIFVAGDRVYDMALRFKSENMKTTNFESYQRAVKEIIKRTKKNEVIYVLPTYSAMLELRKFLIGKKFI
ncbi:MAG: MurT ligase domain-containing protein [Microgenomates group bacterium]